MSDGAWDYASIDEVDEVDDGEVEVKGSIGEDHRGRKGGGCLGRE